MPRKDGRPRSLPVELGLDPRPLVHEHEGCYMDGERALLQDRNPQDVFDPRPGYVQDEDEYYA